MREYLIAGAGHQGVAMAAHFSLNGEKVKLWNRSYAHIADICATHTITCHGLLNADAYIPCVSTDLSEVITDTIFITTPSTAHYDIAVKLAPLLLPDTVIFLNPGRTFGAVEFLQTLLDHACSNIPVIVETQSIVYTCRRMPDNHAQIYALKDNVPMAYIGADMPCSEIRERMPACIRDRFTFVPSVLHTSLSNIGMILHCAPVLMNIGWIESDKHFFYYYYDGISPSVGSFLEIMDKERMAVANALGVETKSLIQWFRECYGVEGESIFDCIQKNDYYRGIDAPTSIAHRYLDEDVPNGLVPLEHLGKQLGVDVHAITTVIDMAQLVRGTDYRMIGRRYNLEQLNRFVNPIGKWKDDR